MFVCDSIRKNIVSGLIYDSGANLSDHLPLSYSFKFDVGVPVAKSRIASSNPKYYSWRWDKADLGYYYDCSFQYISNFVVPCASYELYIVTLVVVMHLTCGQLMHTMSL